MLGGLDRGNGVTLLRKLARSARRQWLPLLLAPPALVAVLFNSWEFIGLWRDHDRAVEDTGTQTQAVAREVSRALTSALAAAEIQITDHLQPMAAGFSNGRVRLSDLHAAFQLVHQRLPQMAAAHVFDIGGHLVASSKPGPRAQIDLGGSELLARHRGEEVAQSVLVAALDRATADVAGNRWRLYMVRTVPAADGGFGGLVVVAFDTEFFFAILSEVRIESGIGASVRIFDGEARLLLNHPRDISQIGRTFAQEQPFQDWQRTRKDQVGRIPDPTDGTPEIGAYRKVEHYPLFVSVGVAEDLALAEWWRDLAILLFTVLVFAAASAWSVRRQLAQWVLHMRYHDATFMDGDGI
ncbi:conserved hypothetical protein [Candidatus Terasakiella magnetica]|nr:conserved hypothetical protein [Candidatus Terasakiella magnetica]